MINVSVDQNVAHVNVVANGKCPYCECDPCDCDWGLSELFKTWNTGAYKTLVRGLSSSCDLPSIEDFGLPEFDCIYNNFGTGIPNNALQHYPSTMIDYGIYKVGDLVYWHPFYGLCDFNKPWIIKTVFSSDPLDCSYHDYEITDGFENHLVTFNELRKLEEK